MQKALKEIKSGEVLTFGGYEWIKLEEEGLCLMKDILEERTFDDKSNDWIKSELREYLNNYFYETLTEDGADEKNFLQIETDLTADDGLKDYGTSKDLISLMTADLYRKNKHLLNPLKDWWWLATPNTCLATHKYIMRCVSSAGMLNSSYVYYNCGVRPVICLQPDALVEVTNNKDNSDGKEDITELIKKWAVDRNVVSGDTKAQMVKLLEEAGELAEGINKNKLDLIIDSVGDVYVVLVILCMQLGLDINDCIKAAYEEIKDRRGELVNGLFVKEEDL